MTQKKGQNRWFYLMFCMQFACSKQETNQQQQIGPIEQKESSPPKLKSTETPSPLKNRQEEQQRAKEVLEQSAIALGGKENFQKIHTFVIEAKIEAKKLGLEGSGKSWWKEGDNYVEVNLSGVGTTRVGVHQGEVWGEDPINGLRKISDREAEQAMWTTSICLVCDWQKYFREAEVVATHQEDNKSILDIKFTSPSQDEMILSIDMDTKLPIAQKFRQASAMGDMPITVHSDDFRLVSGIKIPFLQITDTPLAQFSASVSKFEVNLEIDEKLFLMPTPSQPAQASSEKIKTDKK